jgi:hypothetical protein
MRLFAVSLLLLVSCSGSPGEDASKNSTQIEGTVRESGSNVPIAGASVFLVRPLDQLQVRTLTDAEGKFSLRDLDAGRHLISASRDGYVVPGRQDFSGLPFEVPGGQRLENVVIPMNQTGIISGRVFRADGSPAPRVEIQLLQNLYLMGRAQWSAVTPGGNSREVRASSNERGEFRVSGVDPGQYLVRFIPGELTVASRVPGGLSPVPMLYPQGRDPSTATIIEVKPGSETLLENVRLKDERRAWIRVRVINESGQQLEGFGTWSLKPVNWIGSAYPLVEDRITDSFHEMQPDSPGTYDITATWPSPAGRLVGTAQVQYRGSDVEIRMAIRKPQSKVTGRVLLQPDGGDTKPLAGAEVAIGPKISYFARSGADGAVSFNQVYAGRYQLGYVRGLPADTFVLSARQAARDLFKEEMLVEGAEVNLEIVASSGAPVLEGKVADANGSAVHNALVVLVPESPLKERRDYYGAYKETRTDQNGEFEIRGITPGEYQAYAWTDAPAGAFRNAQFMRDFEGKGTRVKLERGAKATVELKRIEY